MRRSVAALTLACLPAFAQEKVTLDAHRADGLAVLFSPDGKLLASSGSDGVRLYDTSTLQPIGLQRCGADPINGHWDVTARGLAFSPDGKRLAIAADPPGIWEIAANRWRQVDDTNRRVAAVVFSPDGRWIATAGIEGIKVWGADSLAPLRRWSEENGNVFALALSPDGKTLAAGIWDKTVRLIDAVTLKETARITVPRGPVNALAFRRDGKLLAIGSDGGEESNLVLWDPLGGKEVARLTGAALNDVYGVAFSPDGKWLVSGSKDYTVKLWNVERRKQKVRIGSHFNGATGVAFSPDGKTIASTGQDGKVRLYDLP